MTDLPEIDKNSPSFRAYAYGDKDSVTNYWLDRGAAGWRMDVAPWVHTGCMGELRKFHPQNPVTPEVAGA